jgi:CheY-like chemotaxis protein
MVSGDPDHVTQVAANLLINSQHALTANRAERRIKVTTFRKDDATSGFSVEDNGPGIPESIRPRIFESYFTTKPAGAGTGIGLSISRSIVERHNGRIWFEPVEPSGARFTVELPAIHVGERTAADAAKASSTLHQALIIDDEPDVGASLADILELMGVKARVITAWGSVQATLGTEAFDIVFSDLRMPGTGGIEIYRQVLAERPELAPRFVMVTGDMIGARAEIEVFPPHVRPQILEKPFSTLDVRSVLAAINDQVNLSHRP